MGGKSAKVIDDDISTLLETAKVNDCYIYSKHDSQKVRKHSTY